MSDTPISEADKIRLKRLAKLQSSSSSNAAASSSEASTSQAAPAPLQNKPASPAPAPKPKPPVVQPAASTSRSVPNTPPQSAAPARFPESFEVWEAAAISRILGVTLDRQKAEDSSWELVWLKSLLEELQEEHASTTLSNAITDRLLIARLSLDPTNSSDDPEHLTVLAGLPAQQTAFEYLTSCWKQCWTERSKIISRKNADQQELARRLAALESVRSLVISYTGLNLQEPSMFPQPEGKPLGAQELVPIILSASTQSPSSVIPPNLLNSFLSDLCKRFTPSAEFPDENSLTEVLGPTVSGMAGEIQKRNLTMSAMDWQDPVRALAGLTDMKPLAAMMTELPEWSPNTHVALFELASFLGPIIRLGCFPDRFPDVARTWFPLPSETSPQNLDSSMNTLRASIKSHQEILLGMFNNIVRASPAAREAVLQYFAKALGMNVRRSGMQVDSRSVASDSFMVNLQSILLNLATPFIDAQYSKIDKVDIDYFRKSNRIDMAEETKVHATKQEWLAYAEKSPAGSAGAPNFISEVFFLCAWSLHLGYMPAANSFEKLNRRFHDYSDHIREIEADQSWVGGPQEAQMRAQLTKMKKDKDRFEGEMYAIQTHLLDPAFVSLQVGFSNFLMTWLVRAVDPVGKHPQTPIVLPLPEQAPEAFNMLPEFLFEDVIGFFQTISRMHPQLLAQQPLHDLLTFMIVFLSTPYLKNPYIKGKFVEILFYNTRRSRDNTQGALGDVINTHPLALKYLMPALMRIYVDIETTGHHTQFYDKFNIRYYIAMIFRVMWTNPTHREALRREADRVDQFVRFINLLINDTTYLLDESLTNLLKIRTIQRLKQDVTAWNALDAEQKKDRESELKQAERTAKMDINLCNETVRLLKLLTEETSKPFARPEIVDRLAAMLNYNVNLLAGPQSQDLKVDNMQDYKWQPKLLLSDVLSIYLNLADLADFHEAIAREGRSYSKELFDKAENIARRTAMKTKDEIAKLRSLIEKVEKIRADDIADEEAGEVPDEFLDPLTYALMRDPVMLPKAKQSIDRSSIVQHLLSDPRCPFTSTPLTIEECLPDVELKSQIDAFLAERKSKRTEANSAASGMDIDPV